VCRAAQQQQHSIGMWVTRVRPHLPPPPPPPRVQIKHHRRHQWVTLGCVTRRGAQRAMKPKEAARRHSLFFFIFYLYCVR